MVLITRVGSASRNNASGLSLFLIEYRPNCLTYPQQHTAGVTNTVWLVTVLSQRRQLELLQTRLRDRSEPPYSTYQNFRSISNIILLYYALFLPEETYHAQLTRLLQTRCSCNLRWHATTGWHVTAQGYNEESPIGARCQVPPLSTSENGL